MASHINDTLTLIDSAIGSYAQTVFTGFAGPVTTMIQVGGLVGLALVAANTIFQFTPVRMSSYMTWGVRYVVILSVATTWSQFQPIYNILTNTPGSIGAALLGATGAPNLNIALDQMVTEIFNFSDRANAESGWLGISLTSVVLIVLGALMACVAILVSALAKVGLAMSVSFAPAFIASLLFSATKSLFESWTRFTIGFALIPLVLAGVMGTVVGVGQSLVGTASGANTISAAAGFIIVIFAAIFMMFNIPSLVTGLAGTIVTTGTGIAEARAAARNASNTVTAPVRTAYSGAARYDAGKNAAENVRENGGGRVAQTAAFVTQAARMSRDRQRFSDPGFLQQGGSGPGANKAAQFDAMKAGAADRSAKASDATRTQTALEGGRNG
ncbi:MAG: type IV secretion system protein [bacterium]|nr:type IV secretion system protein [bacterium]